MGRPRLRDLFRSPCGPWVCLYLPISKTLIPPIGRWGIRCVCRLLIIERVPEEGLGATTGSSSVRLWFLLGIGHVLDPLKPRNEL